MAGSLVGESVRLLRDELLRTGAVLDLSGVEKADESRLSLQGRKVLALFREASRKGQTVTTAQLAEIGAQYQGRVFECRRWLVGQGYCIDLVQRGRDGLNHYAVVPLAKSTFYAKHKAQLDLQGVVPEGM